MPATTRTPAFCTQCRSRCGCVAVVEDGRLSGIEPLPGHPTGDKLCPKGRAAPELVYHTDRLTRPMRRTNPKGAADPGWQPISWDEALDEIALRLRTVAATHGPEQVAFSATTPSGTHISDGISWIERFVRAYGSPNSIYATEICNWHKDYATRFTYGTDIGTPDFAHTDCVLLWGNNPAATWLARATEVQKAVKRGARMIVVDPRPTAFAKRADQWLRVAPGTDQALALGLANLLIAKDTIDRTFLTRWSNGPLLVRDDTGCFLRESDLAPDGSPDVLLARALGTGALIAYDSARASWRDIGAEPELFGQAEVTIGGTPVSCRTAFDIYAAAAAEYPPSRVARITGVAPEALQSAADILATSSRVAYFCWNGVGQSITATQTDRAITLLYALTGSYGRQGGNVPGAAATFGDISGTDLMSPAQRAKALGLKERPLGPGLGGPWVTARDVYRAVLEQTPYRVRALVSFGTNILVSQPDTDQAEAALKALDFHVHADFFINATARYADIVLPVSTSWEREGLRTGFDVNLDGLRRVQLRPAVIAPIGEARSDTDIVLGLARRLNLENTFFGGNADRGHDAVLAPAGLSVAALRAKPEGVVLDTTVTLEPYAVAQPNGAARGFATPTRRVEIYSERLMQHGYPPVPALPDGFSDKADAEFPLRLSSAKLVAFCHSQHRNIASLRRLVPDPFLEIAPATASARGVKEGDWLRITTIAGSTVARARLTAGLAENTVFGQHGWWVDGPDGSPYDTRHPLAANINRAISTRVSDPVSGSIPLRSSWCNIEKLEMPAAPDRATG
jgi:anaerobic selenocysteine-containing dehydrogenase